MRITITVEVERRSGKFQTKQDVSDAICSDLGLEAGAEIEVDEAIYEIVDVDPGV